MIRTITQRELRNDSGAVLREVQAGNTVVVSRNGEPIAELRPVSRRSFVPRQVIAGAGTTAAHVDYEQFLTDLDHVVDQSIAAERPLDE
jgi:prevent-host-death family protein